MISSPFSFRFPHAIGASAAPAHRRVRRDAPMSGGAALAALAMAMVLVGAMPAARAQTGPASSQIYVCAGPGGVPEYRNGQGGKGCKRLDLPDVVSVPAGRPLQRAAPNVGRAVDAGAADFPRVDRVTQRNRDSERRAVLQEELRSEESRLAALRAEFNQGQPERQGNEHNNQRYLDRVERLRGDIARSEANAAALRRELANLKD